MPKYHIQKTPMFEQLKNMIYEYAGIEESAETSLPITVNNTQALVDVAKDNQNKDKDQRIKVILKRKEEEALTGDFITGTIYLSDGSVINDIQYGKNLNNIKVELIKTGGGTWSTSVNSDGKYGFERPIEDGEYKVRFTYNGQEFKVIDGTVNNDNIENPGNTDNNAREIDRSTFNDKFKPINNNIAKKIAKWYSDDSIDIVNIVAETESFEIKDIPEEGTPGDPDYKPAVPAPPRYLNLVLEKREEFEITIKKQINAVKVTLADGQIYHEKQMQETIPDEQDKEQVQLRQVIMDEELMHGATIEIEYLITAQTNTSMSIDEIKVIDYIDYERNKLEYKPDLKILLADEKNSDNWQTVTKSELESNEYINSNLIDNDDTNGELEDRQYIVATLKQINEKTYQTRLVVSKLISSSLENEELIYSNSAEVILYSDSEGRRMKWADEVNVSEQDVNIPGNYNPINISSKGQDTAISEDVFIIPPFGSENSVFKNLSEYIEQKNTFLYKEELK